MSLKQIVTRTIAAFDAIRDAIRRNGEEASNGTPVETYAAAIDRIGNQKNEKPYVDTREIRDIANFIRNRFDNAPELFAKFQFISPTNASNAFAWCTLLVDVEDMFQDGACKDFTQTFYYCINLKHIGDVNFKSANSAYCLFAGCKSLIEYGELSGTDTLGDIGGMFSGCSALEEIKPIDIAKAQRASSFAENCKTVKKITMLNVGKNCNLASAFHSCEALEELNMTGEINSDGINLQWSKNLSAESLRSIIDILKDRTGEAAVYTITFGSDNLAKLTERELKIVEDKQWNYG